MLANLVILTLCALGCLVLCVDAAASFMRYRRQRREHEARIRRTNAWEKL